MVKNQVQILQVSEHAITIDFGNTIDLETNEKVVALYKAVINHENKFWLDLIPAYSSLTIIYDQAALDRKYKHASTWVKQEIENILKQDFQQSKTKARLLKIPVCYDSVFALDGALICRQKKISFEELVNLHTQKTYHVFMIGFLPGFAYMGSVDSRIATPRLEKPRTLVPEGSVGIAGEQTGIYPLDSPGGWNIIGKTPVKLFDVNKTEPTLFHPGDEVQFFQFTLQQFESFDLKKFNPVYES